MEPTVRRARIESAIVFEPARSALLGRPNSRPPAGQFRPEIQAPGTEFLDAETGGQKTTPETLMVGRDWERGKWAARSPQKRPLFDRRRFPRFGKTGWWCAQSYANRSPCYLANIRVIFQKKSEPPALNARTSCGTAAFELFRNLDNRKNQGGRPRLPARGL